MLRKLRKISSTFNLGDGYTMEHFPIGGKMFHATPFLSDSKCMLQYLGTNDRKYLKICSYEINWLIQNCFFLFFFSF